VLDLVRRLGKALGYCGHAAIELHWDYRDGSYKYLELNPRINLTVEFDDVCGVPTVWNTYRVALDGYPSFAPAVQRDGLLYLDLVDDLKARLDDGERFWSIVVDHARTLPRKRGGVYLAWDDLRPAFWIAGRLAAAGINRLRPGRGAPRRAGTLTPRRTGEAHDSLPGPSPDGGPIP
jgi:D-aspartate ligase